ncbi:hypothetical protein ACFSBZ_15160 [Amnibacterium flavum]|uniref:Uncharacterized protein n=1 Tax=Amnibacterium flavum TaxID=2173173 RepID=A0A2V1HYU7_9MICO|nr:hypothetical protein [Amnibacterium flavum]PVZ96057.1 hypothetical protein DDQ50_06350 [Amnibacterium flavum]
MTPNYAEAILPLLAVLGIVLLGIQFVVSGVRGRAKARRDARYRLDHATELGTRLLNEIGPMSDLDLLHFYNLLAIHVSAFGHADADALRSLAADARALGAQRGRPLGGLPPLAPVSPIGPRTRK